MTGRSEVIRRLHGEIQLLIKTINWILGENDLLDFPGIKTVEKIVLREENYQSKVKKPKEIEI